VAAVGLSRRAVVSARLNARVRGLPVRVLRGGLPAAVAAGPYDLVVANPPYVPSPEAPSRATRGFDAGADGRSVLDTLCQRVTDLVNPGGSLLFVQSVMSGVDTSLEMLTAQGCQASVVRRVRVPFGPVLGGRLDFLAAAGLIEPGQQEEEL